MNLIYITIFQATILIDEGTLLLYPTFFLIFNPPVYISRGKIGSQYPTHMFLNGDLSV